MGHPEKIDYITDIHLLEVNSEQGVGSIGLGLCVIELNGNPHTAFPARLLEITEVEGVGNVVHFVRGKRVGVARWTDRLTEDNLPSQEATYNP